MARPNPSDTTEAIGIYQSDVIVRTAIEFALADLRANPYLLKYTFAGLVRDDQTVNRYGEKERQKAINWFLKTDIPVVMDFRLGVDPITCISLSMIESAEAEVTLGDVHYQPAEFTEADWAPLTKRFTPDSFDPSTGVMVVPEDVSASLVIVVGQLLFDKAGKAYPIQKVSKNGANYMITIDKSLIGDFQNCYIKGAKPKFVTQLESASYKESFRIGAHVHGDASELIYLHSILVFCLLRYKQELIEGRGFERTAISSSDLRINSAIDSKEVVYSRFLTLTGFVRQYWPKFSTQTIDHVDASPLIMETVGNDRLDYIAQPGQTNETSNWLAQLGQMDGTGLVIK